jgi:ABC-type xylose transport system permease subunit
MTEFLTGVLGLFDGTLRALFGVPVFALFLAGYLLLAVLGLFLLLKDAAAGKRWRR